jgi:hypothetical protein
MTESIASVPTALGYHKINNPDYFMVTTTRGFRLHKWNGSVLVKSCDEIPGGLLLCQPYKNSQIFFVVGTGKNPDFPSNKLCLWDDIEKKVVSDLEFYQPVIDLKIVEGFVVVALGDKALVFNFESDEGMNAQMAEIPTIIN